MPRDGRDIIVGRVVGAFGIRGEVKVIPTTDFPDRFDAGCEIVLRLPSGHKTCRIQNSRPHKGGFVLKLEGIETRNGAEELRNIDIIVGESELRQLEEGRFYVFDIIGLKVSTEDGREQGVVTEVLQGGANDVYVTSTGLCIPALRDVVSKVDIERGEMIIRAVPGLLPDDA
ncbi:MAG: ribosome maturation factor RimM [Armatimonadetes bacterium]|nr:ribosome maturation factor RimM [Armatimonadota bacterium]